MLQIKLPMPHRGQRVVLSDTSRFRWLAAGRRWRKTTLGVAVAVEQALKGQHILWGSPTFDQARIGWSELYQSVGDVGEFRLARMEVGFPTSGRIIFRSLDNPDNARGHTADGIILDEAAMIKERAWYEVLRPIISDTDGWVLALSTPKGRNWFWQEWQRALADDDAMAWAAPTLGVAIRDGELVREPHPLENSDFTFAEARRLYNSLPEQVFVQEFLADFIIQAGLVYDLFNRDMHVVRRDPSEFIYWVMGLDEGYTNPAVILLVGVDSDMRLHVFREFYERGKLQDAIVEQAVGWGREFALSSVVVDASAASLRAALWNSGLPAEASKGKVIDGIGLLQSLLKVQLDGKPRLTVDPACTSTIAEIELYTWKSNKDEPVKRDDHAMDALRYLAMHLTRAVETEEVIYNPMRIGI